MYNMVMKNGQPLPKITTHFVTVTRDMAWDWLSQPDLKNRKVYQATISRYARKMMTGQWEWTGEALKFDPQGKLLDGQHRLWAFLDTKAESAQFLVMHGVPSDGQKLMDTGRNRTPANTLEMESIPHGTIMAPTARLLIEYEAGHIPGSNQWRVRPDNRETLDCVNSRPEIQESVEHVVSHPAYKQFGRPSALAFTRCITMGIEPIESEEFWRRLREADYTGVGDPVQRLRERLLITRAQAHSRASETVIIAYIFKAWNAHVRGKKMGILNWTSKGDKQEKFPRAIAAARQYKRREIA
tara:strand:+ start:967 stop:1860 length:894 start_codon:yes stop_codon:yes gene_type:complete